MSCDLRVAVLVELTICVGCSRNDQPRGVCLFPVNVWNIRYNVFTKKLCGEVFVSGNRSYPNVIDLDHKPERAQLSCGYNTAGGNQGLTNTTFGGKSGTVSGHHSGPPGMTGNYASGAPTQYHHRATAGWNSAPLPAQQYRYGTGPVTQTTMSPYTSYNPNPTTSPVAMSVDS
ncbi:hypothetical protein AGLY_015366 [Aphis glycines]|uniref:Uncharacterized protein n=1 Tax=Aphis glycines TaxID=307491 RepID=A0A6G0T346_APHGL|nr:hypothetical protein AGLY_015366 [Aphis glycines]